MIPVRPVILGDLEAKPVMVAKNQTAYQTLPSVFLQDGNICLSRWALEDDERKTLPESRCLFLYQKASFEFFTGFCMSAYLVVDFHTEANNGIITSPLMFLVSHCLRSQRFVTITGTQSTDQEGVMKFAWYLNDKEIEEIMNNNSVYVYQFNLKELITPYFMSVYSNIVLQ